MEENKNVELPKVNVSPLLAEFKEEPIVTNVEEKHEEISIPVVEEPKPEIKEEMTPVIETPIVEPVVTEPEPEPVIVSQAIPEPVISSPVVEEQAPVSEEQAQVVEEPTPVMVNPIPERPIEAPRMEEPVPPVVEPAFEQENEMPVAPTPVVEERPAEPDTDSFKAASAPVEPVAEPKVETPVAPMPTVSVDPTVTELPKEEPEKGEIKAISKKAQIIGTTVVLVLTVLIVFWLVKNFFLL